MTWTPVTNGRRTATTVAVGSFSPSCTERMARRTSKSWPALSDGLTCLLLTPQYEWRQLRAYVEELVVRFAHLDHTVIPSCWWRHSGHVEALQALRDHERVAYSDNSPGTAATDWHRAFTLIEGRLREWTGHSGCAAGHKEPLTRLRPVDDEDWEQMLLADAERRRQREIAKAANAG